MRAIEFLVEDYEAQLKADINNLLIGAKGNSASSVDTKQLVQQLQQLGYPVDENNIVSLLQNTPVAVNPTSSEVPLSGAEGSDETEDSAEKVRDMAQQATKIG